MNASTTPSRTRNAPLESDLCQYPYADGRRCRMLRHASHPSLCHFHSREERQLLEFDRLGDELASLTGEFKTVSDVNHVIGRLFKLVAKNRIPPRNAALLAYLAQLLLYSQKGVQHEMTTARGFRTWRDSLNTVYPPPHRAAAPPPGDSADQTAGHEEEPPEPAEEHGVAGEPELHHAPAY